MTEDFSSDPTSSVVQDATTRLFWAYNYNTKEYYMLTADVVADGRYCKIWMEQGANVSAAMAATVAKVFDTEIYPKMMETFGIYGNITVNREIVAQNTMEFADWLGDRDGKLALLLLDIQDNYQPDVNEARTAGYFLSTDLLANRPHSNKSDMLYSDTNPEWPGSDDSYKTIAHEMQHLMNYVTGFLTRNGSIMDTWINEGLSAIAEWLYDEQHSEERWVYYNADPSGLIRMGNNFFIWGNRKDEHHYAELDDYATVYLFFHWLRLQTGNNSIFSDLIKSDEYSYQAVTKVANAAMEGAGYDDWGTLLQTWLAANYINASTGPYGYRSDRTLRRIKAKTVPQGTQNVQLYPGEAVYSKTNVKFLWPGKEKNITYVGLTNTSPWVNDKGIFNNGALLTYNANPNDNGNSEVGKTGGVASNINTAFYEQRIKALLSRRTVIDGSSILGGNSYEETPDPAMTGAVTVPVLGVIKLE